jgi:hypothetical protein
MLDGSIALGQAGTKPLDAGVPSERTRSKTLDANVRVLFDRLPAGDIIDVLSHPEHYGLSDSQSVQFEALVFEAIYKGRRI